MKEANELRHDNRFPVTASALFSWSFRGTAGEGKGFTRDISIAGLYISTSDEVPVGSFISMELQLPPLNPKAQPLGLRTRGRVVRKDADGFAAMARMDVQFHPGIDDDVQEEDLPMVGEVLTLVRKREA